MEEDLPFLARPLTAEERSRAESVAAAWCLDGIEASLPFRSSGPVPISKRSPTTAWTGGPPAGQHGAGHQKSRHHHRAIEIGRHPGVVQVTFRAPVAKLAEKGLLDLAHEQYGDA